MEIAKWIVAFVAVANFGGIVADAVVPHTSRQHLWNPNWPPHAKFHNAQTMIMGLLCGIMSLSVLFGMPVLTKSLLVFAAGVSGSYYLAMVFAPLFPGTAWTDPEFLADEPRPFGLAAQQLLTYALCGLNAVAVLIVCVTA